MSLCLPSCMYRCMFRCMYNVCIAELYVQCTYGRIVARHGVRSMLPSKLLLPLTIKLATFVMNITCLMILILLIVPCCCHQRPCWPMLLVSQWHLTSETNILCTIYIRFKTISILFYSDSWCLIAPSRPHSSFGTGFPPCSTPSSVADLAPTASFRRTSFQACIRAYTCACVQASFACDVHL